MWSRSSAAGCSPGRRPSCAATNERAGTYNVGTGIETSTARVLEILQSAVGTSLEPARVELNAGELAASMLDPSRIERDLGWRATIDVETGLRQTLDWYRHVRG